MINHSSASNIVCIWYPSGGFGHFVNAILCRHAAGFCKVPDTLHFGATGDSHDFPLVLKKWFKNPPRYDLPDLNPDQKYPLLIDNGIDDESTLYRQHFVGATVIKLCYDDFSWPIVARTMIEKAMCSELTSDIAPDSHAWPCQDNWAQREKYFLFLRDHAFRHLWKPQPDCCNLPISDLLIYDKALDFFQQFGVSDSLYSDWVGWYQANRDYIQPVKTARQILDDNDNEIDISDLSIWQQAVVNYFVWLRHGVEIPANDHALWFTDIPHLQQVINDLKKTKSNV